MRTLFEIIEGAKDGSKPTHDECYYAMLVLDVMRHFDYMDVRGLCKAIEEGKSSAKMRAAMTGAEAFNRLKRALATDPQQWLGHNIPGDPEYDKMRALAFKVFEKATGEKLR
jgi:hypothetical protein